MRDWARRRCEDARLPWNRWNRDPRSWPVVRADPPCAPGISPGRTTTVCAGQQAACSMTIALRPAGSWIRLTAGPPARPALHASPGEQAPSELCVTAASLHLIPSLLPTTSASGGSITHAKHCCSKPRRIRAARTPLCSFPAQMSGSRAHGRGGGGPPKGLFVDGVWHCTALRCSTRAGSGLTATRRLQPSETGSPL
jgi:hypothetical protein